LPKAKARELAMPLRERIVALGDGGTTTLEWWGERGPAVLCVHGITSSRKSWTKLGRRFAATHRFFAYDQRGHGDSAPLPGPMTLERSLADLSEVAAAIGEPIDALLGHSWGGAVALLGGKRLVPRRVVAIDPLVRVPAGTFAADYVDDLRPILSLPPEQREPAVRATVSHLDETEQLAKVHAMREMTIDCIERIGTENHVDEGAWDLREQLRAYPVPLLLAVAGVDSVIAPEDLAVLRGSLGPLAALDVFAEEGHSLHRTAFDEFAATLAAFLAVR
jgi:pimeloyl-ACP methyl ester carboxylesterase